MFAMELKYAILRPDVKSAMTKNYDKTALGAEFTSTPPKSPLQATTRFPALSPNATPSHDKLKNIGNFNHITRQIRQETYIHISPKRL